jgi:hypothetical protein
MFSSQSYFIVKKTIVANDRRGSLEHVISSVFYQPHSSMIVGGAISPFGYDLKTFVG